MFLDDLEWLAIESKRHASIDNLAKKFLIRGSYDNLKKLKVCLSAYLILEQILNTPDPRYDAFFASIIKERSTNFPKNVRIVSWNYDYQLELAHSEYTTEKRLRATQAMLRVASKYAYEQPNIDDFGVYKIKWYYRIS